MRAFLTCAFLLLLPSIVLAQVTCESLDGGYRECRVASTGAIQMVYELSDNRCIEGVTWGTRMAGVVYVTRGCRAVFNSEDNFGKTPRGDNRVICESDGGYVVCPANTNGGVALGRQLSMKSCVEESSWGYEREKNQIWVDDGCRGEFILGTKSHPLPKSQPQIPALNGVVTCQSLDGNRVECKADTSDGVEFIRAFNQAKCSFGRDWGYDRKGIWVTNGCRAAFAVKGSSKVSIASIVCESNGDARNECLAETHYGVALVRQLGDSECVLDKSWGFTENGVWVSNGCRAQFALGGYRLPAEAVPSSAQKIICDSLDGKRNVCAADTTHGVGLVRQLGDVDCVLNRTWGYDNSAIWVSDGCHAEFAVGR